MFGEMSPLLCSYILKLIASVYLTGIKYNNNNNNNNNQYENRKQILNIYTITSVVFFSLTYKGKSLMTE